MSAQLLVHPRVLGSLADIARVELITGLRTRWVGRYAILAAEPGQPQEDDPDFALSDYIGDPEPPKGAA